MPKIYIGHPKDGESESTELRSLGLRYNKAEPSRIGLIGLRSLEQPGYESYIHHLSGFMYANDTKERQSLHKIGFPIKYPISECFPLLQPPLHVKVKLNDNEAIKRLFIDNQINFTETRQKTGKEEHSIFTATNALAALGPLRSLGIMQSHAPSGQVSFKGYFAYLLATRIFSSFFRTHLYPAYSAPTDQEDYTGQKRRIDEEPQDRKRIRMDETTVAPENVRMLGTEDIVPEETESEVEKIVLRYAKPQDSTILPWGSSFGEVPTAHGIVFPFIHQLANWDKEMVPMLMERHFLRCFGHNDGSISNNFSSFVEAWKSECFSTYQGVALSHMAKIILIALPSQSRPFPIFEDGQYRGCYLVGANFSVAIKATLIRPEPFDRNQSDLRSLFGKECFLDFVKEQHVTSDEQVNFDEANFKDLRSVHNWLKEKMTDFEEIPLTRMRAANANFQTRYLPVTVENVQTAIASSIQGKIQKDWPLHHEAFLSEDPLELNLSAFGPNVPSPHIPGGKEISTFDTVPSNSTCCFRRCQLRSAVSEWRDVFEKKVVRNEPRNLNAKFQYVKVTGNSEKVAWYAMMKEVIALSKEKAKSVDNKRGVESMAKKGDVAGSLDDLFDL